MNQQNLDELFAKVDAQLAESKKVKAYKFRTPDICVETEVQALLDNFDGNLPINGGDMYKVVNFLKTRPWIIDNDYRELYDLALKKYRASNRRIAQEEEF